MVVSLPGRVARQACLCSSIHRRGSLSFWWWRQLGRCISQHFHWWRYLDCETRLPAVGFQGILHLCTRTYASQGHVAGKATKAPITSTNVERVDDFERQRKERERHAPFFSGKFKFGAFGVQSQNTKRLCSKHCNTLQPSQNISSCWYWLSRLLSVSCRSGRLSFGSKSSCKYSRLETVNRNKLV